MRYEGSTALVTGASSGIGAELARGLAQRGADIVAVGRRAEALHAVAEDIRSRGGRVRIVPFDLSEEGSGYRLVKQLAVSGVGIDTVVNCAGAGLTRTFSDSSEEDITQQLRVNINATVELSRALLPQLLQSGQGALVNVASLTAYLPVPGMAVYSASKSFVVRFTEALAYELRGHSLTVMALSPGPTATDFYRRSGTVQSGVRFQTPAQVAATAFHALERRSPPVSVISGTRNRWTRRLVEALPPRLALRLAEARPVGT